MRSTADEEQRLAVLRGLRILDTPPEPAYDDIASLAATVCRSDIGAVNFVDRDRHWTKAIVGVENGQGTSVEAALSFCTATVATEGGALAVGDTLSDAAWREHPSVAAAPHVRFYAGAAIVVRDQPVGVVCVFGDAPRDISVREREGLSALARQAANQLELGRRTEELRKLGVTDALTGLGNRTLLDDRLDLALALRARTGGEVGVLYADVDGFKSVNDRFGHEAGDGLLCDVAHVLRDAVREPDAVARMAGDEFVAVCSGLTGEDDLQRIVDRIEDRLRAAPPLPDGSPAPRLSIGAVLAEDGDDRAGVLRRADAAMYRAKTAPRSRRPL